MNSLTFCALRLFRDGRTMPLTCMVFVTPLLVLYELGILWLETDAARNGCDMWLRQILALTGFDQYLLLPILTLGVLGGWHYVTRAPWRVEPEQLARMAWEATLFAAGLLLFSQAQMWFFRCIELSMEYPTSPAMQLALMPRVVAFVGAGIYEEVFFRLLLIPLTAVLLITLGETERASLGTAAVASSLIFAAAHYQIFVGMGEVFYWSTFVFRFCAGMIFASMFLYRGFGVTVATHVVYDLLTVATNP